MNNFPIADWAVSAYLGFREKQANIIFFEDIEEVPTSKYNIVVAYIEDTNKYFERLGLPPKMALNIPNELEKYTGRKIRYMTMKEFKEDSEIPIFVKPARKGKEFVAGVLTKQSSKELFFKDHLMFLLLLRMLLTIFHLCLLQRKFITMSLTNKSNCLTLLMSMVGCRLI